MVYKSVFLFSQDNFHNEPLVQLSVVYKTVTNDVVYKAFISYSIFKAPGPDKINFRIFRMILEYDSEWFVAIVRHSIRLGY